MSNELTQELNGSLEDKVDRLISAVESIDSRLEDLGTVVEHRLRETRPIWEAVQAQLVELKESQRSTDKNVQGLREDVESIRAETEKGFRIMDRRLEHYLGEVGKVYAYERELEDRVDKIEKTLNQ